MAYPAIFFFYSWLLLMCPLGCLILIICQLISLHRNPLKTCDPKTKLLTYVVYSVGLFCGSIGYSLHLSKTNKQWCEILGLPICFAFYGLSKALVYLFFLRRAKFASVGISITLNKCEKVLFDYIGPIFVLLYWCVYISITSFFFSGGQTIVDTNNGIISFCVVDDWELWFVIFAGCVDLMMSIGSLTLFLPPLIKTMRQFKRIRPKYVNVNSNTMPNKSTTNDSEVSEHMNSNNSNRFLYIDTNDEIHENIDETCDINDEEEIKEKYYDYDESHAIKELVNVMKWNIILTSIASISSVLGVLSIPFMHDHVWVVCLLDPFINANCIFFMVSPNRKFCKLICGCKCNGNNKTCL